nr:MAG TPA: hypothetical protein [Caudoviricetes sp.]
MIDFLSKPFYIRSFTLNLMRRTVQKCVRAAL